MKIARIVIIGVCVALAAFFVVRANSFGIALAAEGYPWDSFTPLESGISQNGREFRVIKTAKDGKMVLAFLEKSNMGFWSVSYSAGDNLEGATLVEIGWVKTTGFRRFTGGETPRMGSEWHNLYCGNNAIKLIDLTAQQLPAGVAMDIQQFGNEFIIHITTYEDVEVLNQISLHDLLLESGCIER